MINIKNSIICSLLFIIIGVVVVLTETNVLIGMVLTYWCGLLYGFLNEYDKHNEN